jgi:hypothetical protein
MYIDIYMKTAVVEKRLKSRSNRHQIKQSRFVACSVY